jgi:hypothetical protein
VSPSLAGYTFTPVSAALTVADSDVTQDFTAASQPAATYAISGRVSFAGSGLPGVTVTIAGLTSGSAVTGSGGIYSFSGVPGGSYTVTASRTGFTFSPSPAAVTITGANATRDLAASFRTPAAGGEHHSLAVKSDGTVWAWGYNYYGQLGDGTTTDRWTPVQVSGITGVVAIAASRYHSLALLSDGTVWAWGYNGQGELGDGTTTESWTPVQTSGIAGVIGIAGGRYHSIALLSDGTVRSWGFNTTGQLGDGTTTDRWTPVQ